MTRALVFALALVACGKSAEESGREAAQSAPHAKPSAGPRAIADVVVGSDPTKLAFEVKPLIGMTAAEVRAAYGSAIQFESEYGATIKFPQALDLPPDAPEKARDLHVDYQLKDGKVLFFSVGFHRSAEPELVKALTQVRGAPTGTIDVEGLSWPGTPKVVLRKKQPAGMTPYLKLSVDVPPGID